MTALTNKQWEILSPLLPRQDFKKGGRPRASDRQTLEGIIWILRTGAQWSEMPTKYGVYTTCFRRFRRWQKDGTWDRIWQALLKMLSQKNLLNLQFAFLDGSFAPAKKGGRKSALPKRVKAAS